MNEYRLPFHPDEVQLNPQTRPSRSAKTWVSLLANITVSLGTIVVALLFLEIGLRWIQGSPDTTRFSAETGWRGQANETKVLDTDGYKHDFQLNSQGMHDTEHPLVKPANTYRILMLGDSFVEARQVTEPETAHQIMENLLNQSSQDEQYAVISAGVPAWGTGQQLLYYRSQGRRYQPDLVLLMVYLGNDITDNLPVHSVSFGGVDYYAPYFSVCNETFDPDSWLYGPGIEPAVERCSSMRRMVSQSLHGLYWRSHTYRSLSPLLNLRQSDFFNKNLPNIHLYVPLENEVFRNDFPRENKLFAYGWKAIFEIIKQLQQEVEADGAELAIVLIDAAEVINLAVLPPEEQAARVESMPYLALTRPDLPEKKFREALAGRDIGILNLQPELVGHIREYAQPLYYPIDKHWNRAGNRVVAEILHRWLRTELGFCKVCVSANRSEQGLGHARPE